MLDKEEKMSAKVGLIKEIDNLGRIVVPKDMRERLGLQREVEVLLTDEGVLIRNPKYKLVAVENENTSACEDAV